MHNNLNKCRNLQKYRGVISNVIIKTRKITKYDVDILNCYATMKLFVLVLLVHTFSALNFNCSVKSSKVTLKRNK
jgi:hypothetical protein